MNCGNDIGVYISFKEWLYLRKQRGQGRWRSDYGSRVKNQADAGHFAVQATYFSSFRKYSDWMCGQSSLLFGSYREFHSSKAGCVWNWASEWVVLYLHSFICLHGVYRDNFVWNIVVIICTTWWNKRPYNTPTNVAYLWISFESKISTDYFRISMNRDIRNGNGVFWKLWVEFYKCLHERHATRGKNMHENGEGPADVMKAYVGVDVLLHSFLVSTLDGGDWSTLQPGFFTPVKNSGSRWMGGWVGLSAVMDVSGKRKLSWLYRDLNTEPNPGPSIP